jgi:hypothetical protein
MDSKHLFSNYLMGATVHGPCGAKQTKNANIFGFFMEAVV